MSTGRRVAVLGGGIAGVTAAWQLAQFDRTYGGVEYTLFEASDRLGGTVETVYRDGFVIECGPDGWVSEKPWAKQLVRELGLHTKLIASRDADRVTWILSGGKLVAIPDGMRMMVPTDLNALAGSPLFSAEAQAAYAAEPGRAEDLKAAAPDDDESIAEFVRRHFGDEVLTKVAAPLLSGVFGGDVRTLSVRAVMPAFVRMEREHGSLIAALQRAKAEAKANVDDEPMTIFTSLSGGTQSLIDRMVSELQPEWIRLGARVTGVSREEDAWVVKTEEASEEFDAVMVALPAHVSRELLRPVSAGMAELHEVEASSAVIAAFAFREEFALPKGFGFLVPAGEQSKLLAATFVDQKFMERTPEEGGRVLRAFFGGEDALAVAEMPDEEIARLAFAELEAILGDLPTPAFEVVRRWPRSLPQYAVGHLERMAEMEALRKELPNFWLLGNTYRGVGLPDLIRDARAAAREVVSRS